MSNFKIHLQPILPEQTDEEDVLDNISDITLHINHCILKLCNYGKDWNDRYASRINNRL